MTYENYPYIYEQYDKTNLSDLLRGIAKITNSKRQRLR